MPEYIDPYIAGGALSCILGAVGWAVGFYCAKRKFNRKAQIALGVGRKEGFISGFEQGRIHGLRDAAQRTSHHITAAFTKPAIAKINGSHGRC